MFESYRTDETDGTRKPLLCKEMWLPPDQLGRSREPDGPGALASARTTLCCVLRRQLREWSGGAARKDDGARQVLVRSEDQLGLDREPRFA